MPNFDADEFDLALFHLARMLSLIVSELCAIDRDEKQPAQAELLKLDTLSWTARTLADQLT